MFKRNTFDKKHKSLVVFCLGKINLKKKIDLKKLILVKLIKSLQVYWINIMCLYLGFSRNLFKYKYIFI
jgi:hypothetical protein